MKNTFKKVFIGFMAFAMVTGSFAQQRAHKKDNESYPKEWKQIARMEQDSFFLTDEARRIAENVLAFQRCTGGWPKNIDMARRMNDKELAKVIKDKSRRDDSTIDNNATTAQMIFLVRLYRQTKDIRYRDAFLQGVEYLLSGQYENGGWPQFWPGPRGYQVHITFNDDAIVNTLNMIRDMMNHKAPYEDDLIDKALCVRLGKAFNKGIECILATQIIKDGEPSVWCQQNDRETLKPAPARAYELPSYCSAESAGIVRLLMELPAPDARVKRAVHGAMKWFDRYKLTGLKCERIVLANGERDTRLVEDPQAKPIWARYYDLKYCEPYVCDRDGLPRRHLEEIGTERRNGYSWYNSRPAELFAIYNAWADKYDPKHKVPEADHRGPAEESLRAASGQRRAERPEQSLRELAGKHPLFQQLETHAAPAPPAGAVPSQPLSLPAERRIRCTAVIPLCSGFSSPNRNISTPRKFFSASMRRDGTPP